jgi:hypothetical protein
MKSYPRWTVTTLFVVALGVSSVARAALVDRGGGLIYDDVLNVTWLANAGASGQMSSWSDAVNWASNFSYYDNVRNQTLTGWRLPTTGQIDPNCSVQSGAPSPSGYNCTGSEMGELFYNELGGVAGQPITTTNNSNYNLFQNIQTDGNNWYWSGEYVPDNTSAWGFWFGSGLLSTAYKTQPNWYAWAVRPGDVAAVSVPAAVWLFGSGLFGLIGLARRKAA